MTEGLKISALGFSVVFLVLIIIWLILEITKKIFEKKSLPIVQPDKTEAVTIETVQPEPKKTTDHNELIAVLAAAIAATLNTETYNIRIKSYKRISKSL